MEVALAMIRLTYDFKRLGMRADRTMYPHKAFMPIAARCTDQPGQRGTKKGAEDRRAQWVLLSSAVCACM